MREDEIRQCWSDAHGFLLKVYRNNPSLEKVSRSSSLISPTTNLFFALFINCMSALLRFLKQKYITASAHKSRRSANVLKSNGKAGSKYTQSAAKITLGFSLRTSAGSASPLELFVRTNTMPFGRGKGTNSRREPSHVTPVHSEKCSCP
jgi:hypothetical protein